MSCGTRKLCCIRCAFCAGLVVVHIAMPDFTPPTIAQIDQFVQLVDDARSKHEVNRHLPVT